ncbi:glycosyltransferase [Fluviicola taffensis]|uniref:Glycosyl transferase group 1 n=1 Tax=Fluviicola taffensis (strain DSM 16823 / NCIMB 13979 / RW262) TaxID=755732 RepID=F2ICG4_FLUTR|nr:glycosyltransferase [Fluviicola taffensis]AEA45434.1 glycosyl transferase group 1 [Fluviicola taffensis DSM 16823]
MKILYIAPKPPAPIVDGGCFAMLECLKGLAQFAEVDGIILETHKHPYTEESAKILRSYLKKETIIHLKTEINPTDAILHFVRRKNYNLARFQSDKLKHELSKSLAEDYDYIVCDSLFAAAQLNQFDFNDLPPIIIRSHNIESEIWKQQANSETSVLKRFYLRKLESTLRKEEQEILEKAAVIWSISEEDQQWIETNLKYRKAILLPVSIAPPTYSADYTQNGFFHLGSMNWRPNQEAVSFLVEKVWKNEAISQFNLRIAGSKSEQYSHFNTDFIKVVGWVNDSNSFMAQSGTLVSPIQSGSGIRIKLLEAMALGVPCITTKLGAAGIDIEQSGIQIADSPESFIKQILHFHQNQDFRQKVGEQSRNYISKVHSFETCNALMKSTFGI